MTLLLSHINILLSESLTAYSVSMPIVHFHYLYRDAQKLAFCIHRALTTYQSHNYLWYPLCTLELKIRFCSVSKFSSFPWSKQSQSLRSKILFFFFAFFRERFVNSCKAKPLKSKLFCFLPFKYFRLQLHQFQIQGQKRSP